MPGMPTDGGNGTENEWEAPSVDRILDMLRAAPRRDVLAFLVNHPDCVVHIDDLADHIVTVRGVPDEPEHRRRVWIGLHHHHLPKLAEEGVIEFDPRSDMLRYTPDETVERWLERIREWTDSSDL